MIDDNLNLVKDESDKNYGWKKDAYIYGYKERVFYTKNTKKKSIQNNTTQKIKKINKRH